MFAIAAPTTVTLLEPGKDGPFTTINFRVNGEDTSRCVMEVVTPAGDTHRLTFTTRGQLVDSQFIDHDSAPEHADRPLSASDYMVDGIDMRSLNPYTHVPPMTADSAYQPPGKLAAPLSAEDRELRDQHYAEAADRAKEARNKLLAKADEDPKAKIEREKQERRERLEKAEHRLDTGKPTTTAPGLDRADNPAGDSNATVKTFPNDETQRLVGGKRMDGSPQSNPSGDPMAPAPSSPLPGSPPPHPLDQPDPGKANTTQTLQGA